MKTKNRLLAFLLILVLSVCVFGLTSCGKNKKCSHKWSDWTVTANATCSETGSRERKCSKCKQTETSVIAALGHDWNEATCTSPKTCKVCSETEGETLAHVYTVETVKNEALKAAASCESAAVYYKSCSCGAISNNDADTFTSGSALGHKDMDKNHICDNGCGKKDIGTHADSKTDKDHVCDYGCGAVLENCADATGDKNHACDVCGKADVSAHAYGSATCEKAATCSECGATNGSALGHKDENKDHACDNGCDKKDIGAHADSASDNDHVCDYGCGAVLENCADAEGDGNHACDVCGKADVSAHAYGNAICEQAATCTECSASTGSPLGHKDENKDHACDNGCGKTDIGAHADSASDNDHVCDYGCGAVLENCADAAGDKNHACDVCGKADVSAHAYGKATCEKAATCSECGATNGSALGHKDENKDHACDNGCGKKDVGAHADSKTDKDHVCDYGCGAVLENCADAAGDKNHACDVCGKKDVSEHTYGAATCETIATCTECGATTGSALGHKDENKDHICDRECGKTDIGAHADSDFDNDHVCDHGCGVVMGECYDTENDGDHSCNACGKEGLNDHSYANATCTAPATCIECGGTEGEALPHAYVQNTVKPEALKSEASCEGAAVYYKSCSCGAVSENEEETFESGFALPHVYKVEDVKIEALKSEATCEGAAVYYKSCSCGKVSTSALETFAYGSALPHTYDGEIVKDEALKSEATCESAAVYYKSCSCGNVSDKEEDTFVSGSALNHKHQLIGNTPATCEEPATVTYKCACGDEYTEIDSTVNNGQALGHSIESVKAEERLIAGCEYQLVYKCQRKDCGEDVLGDIIEKHNHIASITTPATCKTDGVKTLTCACGDTKTEAIPADATGHNWIKGNAQGGLRIDECDICHETKTVTVYEGTKTDEVNAEDLKDKEIELNDANITLDQGVIDTIGKQNITLAADKLNEQDISNLGLSEDQLGQVGDSPIYNFTISNGSENISNFGEENYVTITLPYTLEEGEDVNSIAVWFINENGELESIKATYNNGFVTFKTNHFSYYTVTRLTPAEICALYEHDWAKQSVTGSCTKDAYDLWVCKRCHTKETHNLVVADGHDYTSETHDATCTTSGYILYSCKDCNHSYQTKINATGHDWSVTDSKTASCEANGFETKVCGNCEETYTITFAKLPHVYTDTVVTADCENDGYTLHECDNCDYSYTDGYVAALGHVYSEPVWTWAEDYSSATLTFVCKTDEAHILELESNIGTTVENLICCDYVKTTYTAAVSHNGEIYTDEKTVEEGSAEHPYSLGWKNEGDAHWRECLCGAKTDIGTHVFENERTTKAPTCKDAGEKTAYCVCGKTTVTTIPATGEHNYIGGVCDVCGKNESGCDHIGKDTIYKEISSTTIGLCKGTITEGRCSGCNEITHVSVYTDCRWSSPGPDENGRNVWTCRYCGVQRIDESEYYEVDIPCGTGCINYYTYFLNGEQIYSYVSEGINYSHDYKYEFTLNGTSCTDGYTAVGTCSICGTTTRRTGTYHSVSFKIFEAKFYGACAAHDIRQNVCPCGEKQSIYYEGSTFRYNDSLQVYECDDCGVVLTDKYETVQDGCTEIEKRVVSITINGEELYTYTKINSTNTNHTFNTKATLTEIDGVMNISVSCKECGETRTSSIQSVELVDHDGQYYCDYLFTPDESGYFSINGMESWTTPTKVELYLSENGELTLIASKNYGSWNDQFGLTYALEAGKTYVYRISFTDTGMSGSITFSFAKQPDLYANCYHNKGIYVYALNPDSTSCLDGGKTLNVCSSCCQVMHSDEFADYHYTNTQERFDLSELGACGGYLYWNVCLCGQNEQAYFSDRRCSFTYSYENSTDENGNAVYEEIGTCVNCGLVYKHVTTSVVDGCSVTKHVSISCTLGDKEISFTLGDHTYIDHDFSNGTLSNVNGNLVLTTKCQKCDTIHNSEILVGEAEDHDGEFYYDYTFTPDVTGKIEILGLTGNKYTKMTIYQMKDGELTEITWSSATGNYSVSATVTAGETYVCRISTDNTDDNNVYFGFASGAVNCQHNNYSYIYALTEGSMSCEEGVYRVAICGDCGKLRSINMNYYHNTETLAQIYVSEYGVCGGYIYHSVCACGQHFNMDFYNSDCYFNWTEEYSEDENGNLVYTQTGTCETCGFVRTIVTTTIEDGCTLEKEVVYSFIMGEETIYSATKTNAYVNHKFGDPTVSVDGKNKNVVTTCERCGEVKTTCVQQVELENHDGSYYYDFIVTPEVSDRYTFSSFTNKGVRTELYRVENGEMVLLNWSAGWQYDLKYDLNAGETYVYRLSLEGTYSDMLIDFNFIQGDITEKLSCDHDYQSVPVLPNGVTSCEEGAYIINICTACGKLNSVNTISTHDSYTVEEINLGKYGVCHRDGWAYGYIYHSKCACGWNEYVSYSNVVCDFKSSTENSVDENGNSVRKEIRICEECGLSYTIVTATIDNGCSMTQKVVHTYYVGETEIYSRTTEKVYEDHAFVSSDLFVSDGRVFQNMECEDCGKEKRSEIQFIELQDHDGEYYYDITVTPETSGYYTFVSLTQKSVRAELYRMENGEMVSLNWNAGWQYTWSYKLIEGESYVYRISFDGSYSDQWVLFDLVEGLKKESVCHHGEEQYAFYMPEGVTSCEDGVFNIQSCTQCGELRSMGYMANHHSYEIKVVDLAQHGTCTDRMTLYSCACGQNQYTSWSGLKNCQFDHSSESYPDENGNTINKNIRVCQKCGLRYESLNYSERDYENCKDIAHTYMIFTMGDEFIGDIEYISTRDAHDYRVEQTLLGGEGSSCTDGVTAYYTCKVCGDSYDGGTRYYHETFEQERIDLSEYGVMCGGYFVVYSCACGENGNYSFDGNYCQWHDSSDEFWIENSLNSSQPNGIHSGIGFYSYAYIRTCAVTDPACGAKIRYAQYWMKDENSCMAYRYETWQFGYDPETGTCLYEVTFQTEKQPYHNYDSIHENNCDKYDCPDCGSSYYQTSYYDETGRAIKIEAILQNTQNNGYDQYRRYVQEYMYVEYAEGRYRQYLLSDYSEYLHANGDTSWYKYEYTYSFDGGCTRTTTYSCHDGTNQTETTNYCTTGSHITLKQPTCTQSGLGCFECDVCGQRTQEEVIEAYDHAWQHISENWYFCYRCGLENANGASGDIVMEDLTAAYGNDTSYVVGYYNPNNISFTKYISLILADGTEVRVDGVEIFKVSGVRGFEFSKGAVEAWATENGYTDYDVRISFVSDYMAYGLTFTDNLETGAISGKVSFKDYIAEGEFKNYTITPAKDGLWVFTSFDEQDPRAVLQDASGVVVAENDDGIHGRNFWILYDLKAGETYTLTVSWCSSAEAGEIILFFSENPVTVA